MACSPRLQELYVFSLLERGGEVMTGEASGRGHQPIHLALIDDDLEAGKTSLQHQPSRLSAGDVNVDSFLEATTEIDQADLRRVVRGSDVHDFIVGGHQVAPI